MPLYPSTSSMTGRIRPRKGRGKARRKGRGIPGSKKDAGFFSVNQPLPDLSGSFLLSAYSRPDRIPNTSRHTRTHLAFRPSITKHIALGPYIALNCEGNHPSQEGGFRAPKVTHKGLESQVRFPNLPYLSYQIRSGFQGRPSRLPSRGHDLSGLGRMLEGLDLADQFGDVPSHRRGHNLHGPDNALGVDEIPPFR